MAEIWYICHHTQYHIQYTVKKNLSTIAVSALLVKLLPLCTGISLTYDI
jgi:hypothetical protein